MEFVDALIRNPLLQYAVAVGLLASVATGVVGTYVVVRRITYIAGGIAHCVLGGLGAAYYVKIVHHWEWCDPLYGATVAALLSAAIIGIVSLRAKEREDTVIGALWAIGTAVGVLFIHATPGYSSDLMTILFGNILMVSPRDLWLVAILDLLVVGVGLLFYNPFLAVCFDEEFSRLRGLSVEFYYLLLLCLTALTVVVLMKVVGIVMVIALLTLPVAIAGVFSRTLWQMMLISTALSIAFTTSGLAIAYERDLPAGASIIVLAGLCYLIVAVGQAAVRSRA